MSENISKYTELKISELAADKLHLLAAAIKICSNALWLKEHLFVGDDGEWDYKLNKALNAYADDVKDLGSIKIDDDIKNTYTGELTLEALVEQFEDFYWLVNLTSPLGENEIEFVIAYGYLESEVKNRKKILSSVAIVPEQDKTKKVEKKIIKDWHERPVGVLVLSIAGGLIVAFISFSMGWI